jgi:hypothetical protein
MSKVTTAALSSAVLCSILGLAACGGSSAGKRPSAAPPRKPNGTPSEAPVGIRGCVVDLQGQPVEGVEVRTVPETDLDETGEDGCFHLREDMVMGTPLERGRYSVVFVRRGWEIDGGLDSIVIDFPGGGLELDPTVMRPLGRARVGGEDRMGAGAEADEAPVQRGAGRVREGEF